MSCCKTCLKGRAESINLPCGHLGNCLECVPKMLKCATCQVRICYVKELNIEWWKLVSVCCNIDDTSADEQTRHDCAWRVTGYLLSLKLLKINRFSLLLKCKLLKMALKNYVSFTFRCLFFRPLWGMFICRYGLIYSK